MRWPLAATAALLLLAAGGCAAPARRVPARLTCRAPFNAGARLPGALNPAYPRTGLYPAPGALPPASAPGVRLRVLAPALVVDYGQPLEIGGVMTANRVVQAVPAQGWWQAPLAAGYPFRLFGPNVPVFGVIPAPVLTGRPAARLRTIWLVTEWDAAQTLTVLKGTEALVGAVPDWQVVPAGVTTAHVQQAAAAVRSLEAAGWQPAGSFVAAPACSAAPGQSDPFGERAALRLPLGVPLLLVSPEFGSLVLQLDPT